MVDLTLVVVVVAAFWIVWISAIVSASRVPDAIYRAVSRSKPGTIIMIVLTGFIGGLYFLLRVRRELTSVDRTGLRAPPPEPEGATFKEWRKTRDPWA